MPIHESATKLLDWSNRNKSKVPEFDASTDLYNRIAKLQPYASLAVAMAISADFEPFVGKVARHRVHPPTLLQGLQAKGCSDTLPAPPPRRPRRPLTQDRRSG
jgi:hypothetical protein